MSHTPTMRAPHLTLLLALLLALVRSVFGQPDGSGAGMAERSLGHQVSGAVGSDAMVTEAHSGFVDDLALVAAAHGWTLEEAVAHRAMSDAFGRIQEQVATARPDLYAGAELSPVPDGAPTLYIKGTPDDFVWRLVDVAGFPVAVVDNRPLSYRELEQKSIRLNRLLAGLGFRDIVTTFDERASVLEAVVTRVPGLPAAASEVLAMLPGEFQSSINLELTDEDVATDDHAYGGMWVRDDGVNECTSGWSVISGSTTGVTTAGHCSGINEIDEPDVGILALTHEAEHRGSWGDVEWETSTHIEPDDFYATATDIRDVEAVEPQANITVGEAICVYGRSSNSRDCSETVYRTSISCTNNGVFNDRLVAMNDKRTTIGGDSGGGWSFSSTAYGSHKGGCSVDGVTRDAFSVADYYDEALGVTVITESDGGGKDIVIQGLTVSNANPFPGDSVTVDYEILNQGTETITESYTEDLFLSSDTVLDGADTYLDSGHDHSTPLDPGETHSGSMSGTIPGGTASGTYYLLVDGDANDTVPESDEGNNLAWIQITVGSAGSGKDIVIQGLTVSNSNPLPGDSVTVDYDVANQGSETITESYTEDLFLSSDAILGGGDTYLGSEHQHVVDLPPGGTHAGDITGMIPTDIVYGSYHLLVVGDAGDDVTETDELNNITTLLLTTCDDPMDLLLDNQIVSTEVTYEACNTITVGSGFSIVFPGKATLMAGESLTFHDGFSVGQGARMEVVLGPLPAMPVTGEPVSDTAD